MDSRRSLHGMDILETERPLARRKQFRKKENLKLKTADVIEVAESSQRKLGSPNNGRPLSQARK